MGTVVNPLVAGTSDIGLLRPGRSITASTTATLADSNTMITATHATVAIDITIPNDATEAWRDASKMVSYQGGNATVSFIAGSGVTLHAGVGIPGAAIYRILGVRRVGADEWVTF